MNVYKLTLKTPGIFLDKQGNPNFTGNLFFEINTQGDEWKNVNDLEGIAIISEDNFDELPAVVPEVRLEQSIEVPSGDEGTRIYYVAIPASYFDSTGVVNYRIVATGCVDCWEFFVDIGEPERVDMSNKKGRIIVGEGKIRKV